MPFASIATRIRWENVARLGAVLAVCAVVALWPRLDQEPVTVPEGRAMPVVAPLPSDALPARGTRPSAPKARRPANPRSPARRARTGSRPHARTRPAPARRRPRPGKPGNQADPARAAPRIARPPAAIPAPPSDAAITAAEFGVR